MSDETRLELVLAAVRWANNMLTDVLSRYARDGGEHIVRPALAQTVPTSFAVLSVCWPMLTVISARTMRGSIRVNSLILSATRV